MISSGEGRPRSLRSARKSLQASADSPLPGARPMNAGLPPVVMPQAASTGSAEELGDLGLEGGLHQQPRAEPGDIFEDLRQLLVLGEQLVDVAVDALGRG